MPYKDKEKTRECSRRFYLRNREKQRWYKHILWLAKKANPIRQLCSIGGCKKIGEMHHEDYSKPEEVIWLCRQHHMSIKHTTFCRICGRKALARKLCNKHYKSTRREQDPQYAEKERVKALNYWHTRGKFLA